MPARSSPNPPGVLVAALSGRALAAAARRAGYRPLVADLFQDQDTRRLAARSARVAGGLAEGLSEVSLIAAMSRLAGQETTPPAGFVYGAGFEHRPELLARIGARWPLLGNPPEVVARIKDPVSFSTLLATLSIPHPEITLAPPANPRGWLAKRSAASGGGHIRPAGRDGALYDGVYFQRRVRGRPVSALFLANGRDATMIGFSEQWASSGGPRSPFRFGGAVQPAGLTPQLAATLGNVVRRLAAATRLVGLNSADFMVRDGAFDLLEVNPRPGATLDIFDLDPEAPLFALHCAACRGGLPKARQRTRRAAACAVVYAPRKITVPAMVKWPHWAADRPDPNSLIGRGEPLCTVLARGAKPSAARQEVAERAQRILTTVERRRPRHRPRILREAEAPC
ncbi:MAG: ATP-grasp domain-containing protein [Rhodospirillales bacterium]|nr:ATP-grasp domain-containing protein [Rhodospirillales bacterium]